MSNGKTILKNIGCFGITLGSERHKRRTWEPIRKNMNMRIIWKLFFIAINPQNIGGKHQYSTCYFHNYRKDKVVIARENKTSHKLMMEQKVEKQKDKAIHRL